ncbi:hypothetical protein [Diaphorobacter aerolatus]|uniref:Uncharacterized protein n=1 Tax=Diaphorobacter aerolatus TaxID=1288495 RepID=A0A7H0GK43_9BURK|nr:hypothetical protein [Diaphorobacter aerolatus]QNP48659.1 hypothetical protein H9K75_22915 [Diaphorobacter aerolatus]
MVLMASHGIEALNAIHHAMKKMVLGDTKDCQSVPDKITKTPVVIIT